MKLCIVAPAGVPGPGGVGRIPALGDLFAELARRHELVVIQTRPEAEPRRWRQDGYHVYCTGQPSWPGGGTLGRWLRMEGELASLDFWPDCFHAFWISETSSLAALSAWRRARPLLVSLGGGELTWLPEIGYGGGRGLRNAFHRRLALRRAGLVTAGSRFACSLVEGFGREAREIPLGVALPEEASPRAAVPGEPFELMQAGGLSAVKDWETLGKALRLVKEEGLDFRFHHFGVDCSEGAARAFMEAQGLGDRIVFHGLRSREELLPFMARAHLYIQSSRFESQGVAVCEAAARATATVGTAVGLAAQWAPEAAAVVPVGQAPALARAIVEILGDGPQREAMGRKARKRVEGLTVEGQARAFEALYERLAREGTG